jgi:hypothetical protein
VLAITLTSGLGTIVALVRILPLNADTLLPFALTVTTMLIAGLLTLGILKMLARRNA